MNTRSAFIYFLALAVVAVAGACWVDSEAPAPDPDPDPPLDLTSYSGDALVGVDEYGRVLIALDEDPVDETVDRYFRFTATERLDGPCSEIVTGATIQVVPPRAHGGSSLVFRGGHHLLSLAADPSSAQALEGESITLKAHRNLEFHMMKGTRRKLSEHDIGDLTTWPRGYERDTLGEFRERFPDSQHAHEPTDIPRGNLCAGNGK